MGAAFAKDEDDEFADLGAKVTGATPSVAASRHIPNEASRHCPNERSGLSELSTAPPSAQHLELPVLEPEGTMTTEDFTMSPREASQSSLLCAPRCEVAPAVAQALVDAVDQASKNELPRWGSADSFRLLCSGIGSEAEVKKEQCPFQLCKDPSGYGHCPSGLGSRWAMTEEVVVCEEMEDSSSWRVSRSLTPRRRLPRMPSKTSSAHPVDCAATAAMGSRDVSPRLGSKDGSPRLGNRDVSPRQRPRFAGQSNGYVQPMALTHEPVQSHRGMRNHQEHKEAALQMHLAAVSIHERAEEAAWAVARAERRRKNLEAENMEAGGGPSRGRKVGLTSRLF